MTISIIGVGLIGGSMALCLRNRKSFFTEFIGVENNSHHAEQALQLGIVDKVMDLEGAIRRSDVIIVSTPVDVTAKILHHILDAILPHQIVIEVGSTKKIICELVAHHPSRKNLVATHPMWGTEYSGPTSATQDAFTGRVCIVCETEKSNPEALKMADDIYQILGMKILTVNDASSHDMHLAYVSHISHISSFALASTVLEKEKEEERILQLASSGFDSTVRLAKSNVHTWAPIFMQNKHYLIEVLDEYIHQVEAFKQCLINEDKEQLSNRIKAANAIKKILK